MPRPSKGPRLWLRERPGREAVYVIRDGSRQIGTGCVGGRRGEAEKALAEYIRQKHRPDFRDGDPAHVLVDDVLRLYVTEHAPHVASPESIGYHMIPLGLFFAGRTVSWISGATCRRYADDRTAGRLGRVVVAGTARRELETLSAALGYAYRERQIDRPVPVTFPEKAPPRERWLTRTEAARLVAGALGWCATTCGLRTRELGGWRRIGPRNYHVARFILIALYTGTRHDAILRLRWGVNSEGGWFDLDRDRLYRRGAGQRETNKRRPPAPLPRQLAAHARRWRRLTINGPVEYEGELLAKERRGFARACLYAHLDGVTPHTLKHTSITWMLQRGVSTWEAAGYYGTSEAVIRNVYGHHATDYLRAAAASFGREPVARHRNAS